MRKSTFILAVLAATCALGSIQSVQARELGERARQEDRRADRQADRQADRRADRLVGGSRAQAGDDRGGLRGRVAEAGDDRGSR